jgi:beta-glucanase (GH16 family)
MSRIATLTLVLSALVACNTPPPDPGTGPIGEGEWELVWSDEFDGAAGGGPDPNKWVYDIGGGGWGNGQLEFNTDSRDNSALDGNGQLVITARAEEFAGNAYTSARIRTQGKLEQLYGKFEARIKLPTGRGIWPAFWLLGANLGQVGWPACGELDIMEARGDEPSTNHGSAHGPGYSGGNPLSKAYDLPNNANFADGFHVFTVEWQPGVVRWFVDGEQYHSITEAQMSAGKQWVFDSPMFIIFDLAVGGAFSGDPDSTTVFPQEMVIDYVRVYELR